MPETKTVYTYFVSWQEKHEGMHGYVSRWLVVTLSYQTTCRDDVKKLMRAVEAVEPYDVTCLSLVATRVVTVAPH